MAFHRDHGAVYRESPCVRIFQQVQELPSRGFFILVSCDNDTGIFGGSQGLCILGAGASGEHAGAGEEHHRAAFGQKRRPVLGRGHSPNLFCVKRFYSLQDAPAQRIFQVCRVSGVHAVDIPDHAVHIHRHRRDLLVLNGSPQEKQHFLGPAQGEGGDQHFFLLADTFSHQLCEPFFLHLPVGVKPAAVGGFQDGHIRAQPGDADSLDGALGESGKVAGIEETSLFRDQVEAGGPGDMACRITGQGKSFKEGAGGLEPHSADAIQHGQHILLGVVGNLVLPAVHYFQAVIQQHLGQVRCHGRHVYGGGRVGPADDGQGADVVHMGVAYQDGVHAAVLLHCAEIRYGVLGAGLPYAAVHKDSLSGNPDINAAASYLHSSAKKMKLHNFLYPFRPCIRLLFACAEIFRGTLQTVLSPSIKYTTNPRT